MSKPVQRPVIDRADIPAEFVPMASYGAQKPNQKIKSSPEYQVLAKAWLKKELGGIKLVRTVNDNRGNIFVNKLEADELIAARLSPPKTLREKCFEVCSSPKHTTELSTLVSELQVTNEKMLSLITQVQSAIRAEQDDKNLTLFN
jgi:hypothetical protein